MVTLVKGRVHAIAIFVKLFSQAVNIQRAPGSESRTPLSSTLRYSDSKKKKGVVTLVKGCVYAIAD